MEDPQTLGNTIQNTVTLVTWKLAFVQHKMVKVKLYHYRPEQAHRVPGG